MDIIAESFIHIFLSGMASLCFAIIFNAPRKELLTCSLTGSLGLFIYLLAEKNTLSPPFATFFGAMAVTIIARLLSYTRSSPSTLFLIPGIIPLVPGANMYNTMKAVLENDLTLFYLEGTTTLKIAGVIAIGIIVIFTLPYKTFAIFKPKD